MLGTRGRHVADHEMSVTDGHAMHYLTPDVCGEAYHKQF